MCVEFESVCSERERERERERDRESVCVCVCVDRECIEIGRDCV